MRDRDGHRFVRSDAEEVPAFVEEELLSHPTRKGLLELIRERPGRNKHQIAQELDVDPSVVDHHLKRLCLASLTITRKREDSNEIHCFVAEDERLWDEERTRSLFGRGGQREVALYLAENPGAKTHEIAAALELSATTIRHHLQALRERDLVRQYSAGRTYLYDASPILDAWVETVGDKFDRPWLE